MKLVNFWLASLLPTLALAQNNPPALLKAEKIVRVRIYQDSRLTASRQYDANGNTLTAFDDSFMAETIHTSSLQKFDADNQLMFSKNTHSASRDTMFWRYQYNAHHQLTAMTNGYTGQKINQREYDATGQLLRETSFDASGLPNSEQEFTYDKQGREIEEKIDLGGKVKGRIVKKAYDSQGREIKSEMFDKGELRFTMLTEYYNTGEKGKVIYLEGNGANGVVYTYDSARQLQSRRHFQIKQNKEITTGNEEFTYLPSGLINTFSEDIFSFRHVKRIFSYQYN